MSPQFYVYIKRGSSRRWSKLVDRWISPGELKYRLSQIVPQQFDRITWDRVGGGASQVSRANIQLSVSSSSYGSTSYHSVGYQNRVPRVYGPRWSGDYTDMIVYIYGGADYGHA